MVFIGKLALQKDIQSSSSQVYMEILVSEYVLCIELGDLRDRLTS